MYVNNTNRISIMCVVKVIFQTEPFWNRYECVVIWLAQNRERKKGRRDLRVWLRIQVSIRLSGLGIRRVLHLEGLTYVIILLLAARRGPRLLWLL